MQSAAHTHCIGRALQLLSNFQRGGHHCLCAALPLNGMDSMALTRPLL
jgi:hypothetical protein